MCIFNLPVRKPRQTHSNYAKPIVDVARPPWRRASVPIHVLARIVLAEFVEEIIVYGRAPEQVVLVGHSREHEPRRVRIGHREYVAGWARPLLWQTDPPHILGVVQNDDFGKTVHRASCITASVRYACPAIADGHFNVVAARLPQVRNVEQQVATRHVEVARCQEFAVDEVLPQSWPESHTD